MLLVLINIPKGYNDNYIVKYNIIESVDSVSRDGKDVPYILYYSCLGVICCQSACLDW